MVSLFFRSLLFIYLLYFLVGGYLFFDTCSCISIIFFQFYGFSVLFHQFFPSFLTSLIFTFHVASSCFPLSISPTLFLLPSDRCFKFFFDTVNSFFSSVFSLLRSNYCLYIVVSRSQLNSFPVSYPASTALWRFHLSSHQPIRTCCQFVADIFLFLTHASIIILHARAHTHTYTHTQTHTHTYIYIYI